MNDVYWREDTRAKEEKGKARLWLAFCYILIILYCGMLFIEALFFDGSMRTAVISLIGASPLLIVSVVVYLNRHKMTRTPMVVAIATTVLFLGFGTYLHELDYYYFVMFTILGIVMVAKNFILLRRTTLIVVAINLIYIIGIMPRLEWLNHFRFVAQFIFFLLGSVFFLFLTHNVDLKETGSNRALAAFTALLSSTPNLMAVTDNSGRVLYLSNQFLKFIGYPRKEYTVGQPLIDLITDWKLKMIFADLLDAGGFFETEIDLKIDGEDRHFKLTTDKLTGALEGVFIDISDVTPIYHAKLMAEEANRSKSNFLATMSHEIRTPLNAIIGITQIQLQNENLPAQYATSLEKVNSAGSNLLSIINDILDMSKIESGNLELHLAQYDIPSVVNDAVQLNIVRIGKKPIQFVLDIEENMPSKMYGDETRLKQILNNLLSNAVKYTDKGEVRLTVNALHDAVTGDGDIYLVFTISDTGQGILPEDMNRLFSEQYLRLNEDANRTTEGTGLGLSITKKLVEIMDGTITVSSTYGEGSVFTVVVKQKCVESPPIGAQTAKSLREFTYVDGKFKDRRKTVRHPMPYGRVLVVDDSASNLYVAEGLLSPYKLKIETVDSGFKALDRVESGERYDIIFMDHMMPRMDGIETVKRLRDRGYREPIVALTANALAGNDVMFAQNGFDGYIPKPIDTRRLDEVLNKFICDRHPEEAEFHKTKSIAHAGEVSVSSKLMQVFCAEAERAAFTLKEAIGNEDIKLLTTTAHAMKSALANVGRQEISAQAASLERAGTEGDKAFINANAEGFIGALEGLVNELRIENGELRIKNEELRIKNEKLKITNEDFIFLKEQLESIKKACEEYDDARAIEVLDMLREKQWGNEINEKLEAIRDAIYLDSDFDGAAALAGEMC